MRKVFVYTIKKYQKNISPILSDRYCTCKYYPSCSEYTIQAIEKYGSVRGSFFGIKRILKCNPLSKGGYDPLK